MERAYPFIIRAACDGPFIAHVEELMKANASRFTPNTADPARRKFWEIADDLDPVLEAKKLELAARFGIGEWIADPNYHDLICCIAEGGYVHPHVDTASEKRIHVRINLLVAEPEEGCVPLLDGIPIAVGLTDAWLCFASHCAHATTPVIGKKSRIIVSYGLQADRVAAFGLLSRYLTWKSGIARSA